MLSRWHSHTMQALADRGQHPNEVWYWAAEKVTLYSSGGVVSHTFVDGKGVITYDVPVVTVQTTLRETPVTAVSLPPTCTAIINRGFYLCSELREISMPGVESIGIYTFYNCTSLAISEMPAGVATIAGNAFYGCAGLTELTFLGTPNAIESTAFRVCNNLTIIRVPWSEGEVAGAPWGATNATITYNYTPQ